jgi:AcrR family transcriptional regulator
LLRTHVSFLHHCITFIYLINVSRHTDQSVCSVKGDVLTKEKIMETAFKLFIEKTYSKVSIDEIARTTGVSKGAIFHYFKSKYELAKDSLFFAIDKMWMKDVNSFDPKKPAESAKKLIDNAVDTSLKNWKMIRYVLDIHEAAIEQGEKMEDWGAAFAKFVIPVAKALKACGTPNPEIKALLLIISLDAVGMEYALMGGNGELPIDLIKKEFFELFVGNYLNRPRGDKNE